MLNFKNFVLNVLAGPNRKFLGMAMKKFGNFTWPSTTLTLELRLQICNNLEMSYLWEQTLEEMQELHSCFKKL